MEFEKQNCCNPKCDNMLEPNGPINAFISSIDLRSDDITVKRLVVEIEDKDEFPMLLTYRFYRHPKRTKKHIFHIKCRKCGKVCEYIYEIEE